MTYWNRISIGVHVVLAIMAGNSHAQSALERDVYVQGGPKWTEYDVPSSGADLKLNVKKGTAPPIKNSRVRIEDTSDTAVWMRLSDSPELHVYQILGVFPGHEWVSVVGDCGTGGEIRGKGRGTGGAALPFEVGVLKVEIEEPDGLPVKEVQPPDGRCRLNPYCFEWQFVHVSNERVAYHATQPISGLIEPIPPAGYNWSVSKGALNSPATKAPTYVPNGIPVPATMTTVELKLRPISGSDVAFKTRTLEVYRDHLERDYQNFGTGIECGARDKLFHWKFTRYGISWRIIHSWNCHGSVWHAFEGTHDGDADAVPLSGFTVSTYDDPIAWETAVANLKRGDIVSFYTHNPATGKDALQHSHTCLGSFSQMYGANNEPVYGQYARGDGQGHYSVWEGGSWRWWTTSSQAYYDNMNRGYQNMHPDDPKLINRIKVHRR